MKAWKKLISLNLALVLLLGMFRPIAAYAAEGSGEERFRAVAWATGEACIDPAGLEYSVPQGSVLFSNGMILHCGMTPGELGVEYEVTYEPESGEQDNYIDIADINAQLALVIDAGNEFSNGYIHNANGIKYMTIDGETAVAEYLDKTDFVKFDEIFGDDALYGDLSDENNVANRLFILHKSGSKVYLETLKNGNGEPNEQLSAATTLLNGYYATASGEHSFLDTTKSTVKLDNNAVAADNVFFACYRDSKGNVVYDVMALSDLTGGFNNEAYAQVLTLDNARGTRKTVVAGYVAFDLDTDTKTGYLYVTDDGKWDGDDISVVFPDGIEKEISVTNENSDILLNVLYRYIYNDLKDEYTLTLVAGNTHYVQQDRNIVDFIDAEVYTSYQKDSQSFELDDETIAVVNFEIDLDVNHGPDETNGELTVMNTGIEFVALRDLTIEQIEDDVDDAAYTQYTDYVYVEEKLFYVLVYHVMDDVKYYVEGFDPATLYTLVFGKLPPAGVSGNVSWALDNGVLTLSGTGRMNDYAAGEAPWIALQESIQTVRIAEGITSVGANAFAGCTALTEVQLPESVTRIGAGAFSDCTALTGIELPETVVTLDDQAFSGCTALSEITLPEGLQDLGEEAFAGCRALTTISIPGNAAEIGRSAFSNCSRLSRVEICDGVESIGAYAFSGCTALNHVDIPDSVTEIGAWAFYRCTGLVNIQLPAELEVLRDSVFSGCSELNAVGFPAGLREIGASAFRDCGELTELIFPDSVRKIGASAFYGCVRLRAAQLPEALQSLGKWAFRGCSRLVEIRAGRGLMDIGDDVFLSAGADLMIYGYAGSRIIDYARQYGIDYTVIQIPRFTLRVYSNAEGVKEQEEYQGYQGAVIPMGEVADKLQKEYFLYASDADLVGWNTQAGGTGVSYDRDVSWVMEADAELYAQWKTAEYTVDGQRYPVTEARQGSGWTYEPENRVLTLNDYQGGGIAFPGCLQVAVTGRCSVSGTISAREFLTITIPSGASLSAKQLAADELTVRCDAGGTLTVSSGTNDPPISAEGAHFYGKGTVHMESAGENALFCTAVTVAAECRLTASAQKYAVPGRLYFTPGSLVYLSAESTEPERYAPGPYLRMEPWQGKVTLNANGGTWAGIQGSSRQCSLYYGEEVDLGQESQSLSRSGYRLVGWQDAEDRTEYSLVQTVSAENLTLFADWVKRELRIDGTANPIDRDSSGTGWTYRHPTEAQPVGRVEIRAGYSGKPIYSSEDLEIVFTGDHTIAGRTGEPAVWSLGDLTLRQKTGSLTLRGGDGESAVRAGGVLLTDNAGELTIQGGSGGIGLLAGKVLSVNNGGTMTATGGVNGHAAAGPKATFAGSGKTILVGAGVCAASSADLVLDGSLKYYTGSNAGNALRGGDLRQARYIRLQPRSILVTLYANGGTVCGQEIYEQEYPLADSSEVTLAAAQGAFGAVFTGWNTRLDGSGQLYPAGVPLAVDDSEEELRLFAQYRYLDQVEIKNGTVRISFSEALPERTQKIFLAGYDPITGQMVACASGAAELAGGQSASFRATGITEALILRVFILDQNGDPLGPARTILPTSGT